MFSTNLIHEETNSNFDFPYLFNLNSKCDITRTIRIDHFSHNKPNLKFDFLYLLNMNWIQKFKNQYEALKLKNDL